MSPENFCYWLRGFFELNGDAKITEEQAELISKHLTLVFEEKAKNLPKISYDNGKSWGGIKPLDAKVYCSSGPQLFATDHCFDPKCECGICASTRTVGCPTVSC